MSSITIIKPGLFTTIQDAGRYGYRKYGIPLSGTMDNYAAGLANALVNKPFDSAVIEIILKGPEIQFNDDTYIAITGADMAPYIDGNLVKMNVVNLIKRGSILSFGKINYGAIAYIATSNELLTEIILGSKSYYKGITPLKRFYSGQTILLDVNREKFSIPSSRIKPQHEHFLTSFIKVYKGPEFNLLCEENQKILSETTFKISFEFSRMGYKLEGHPIIVKDAGSMISSAVMPGTVQLTPGGQMIVLMNDCQTTGGYPRILQLSQNSINQLAQKKAGDEIKLRVV